VPVPVPVPVPVLVPVPVPVPAPLSKSKILSRLSASKRAGHVSNRYELSPMTVRTREARRPWLRFVTSACAIVGGVLSTMGASGAPFPPLPLVSSCKALMHTTYFFIQTDTCFFMQN
jgi:hypothetical protein